MQKRSVNAHHQKEKENVKPTQKIAEAHAIHKRLKEKKDKGDFVLQMVIEQSDELE